MSRAEPDTNERPADGPSRPTRPTRPTTRPASHLASVLTFPSLGDRSSGDAAPPPQPAFRDVLGDVLREERLRQQRTLGDVASNAAVSLPYLSEVERGRKEISSDLLAAVSGALEFPLVDVLERCAEHLRARAQRTTNVQLRAA